MAAIQRSRGCTIRFHPNGFRVFMYKDEPGKWFDERGEEVTDKVAQRAGFDVETLRRERAKREKLEQYRQRVEQEFESKEQDVARLLSARTEGLEVKHIGAGKYAIHDAEGVRLTQRALTKREAEELISDMQQEGANHGEAS